MTPDPRTKILDALKRDQLKKLRTEAAAVIADKAATEEVQGSAWELINAIDGLGVNPSAEVVRAFLSAHRVGRRDVKRSWIVAAEAKAVIERKRSAKARQERRDKAAMEYHKIRAVFDNRRSEFKSDRKAIEFLATEFDVSEGTIRRALGATKLSQS